MKKPLLLVLIVLLIDQLLKIYIKTNFYLGEEIHVAGDWFIIHFTENNGMAWGLEFGGRLGKLFLSSFRILAVGVLAWYLRDISRKKEDHLYITAIALIFAGALGNIIDSAFYGLIFSDSAYGIAEFFPAEGGYAGILFGKVVDMFYFPLVEGNFPDWFPFWAGEDFVFFRPVFNFADTAISAGVGIIIFYQKRFFSSRKNDLVNDPDNKNEAQ